MKIKYRIFAIALLIFTTLLNFYFIGKASQYRSDANALYAKAKKALEESERINAKAHKALKEAKIVDDKTHRTLNEIKSITIKKN